jgi:hypothetical protein
LSELVDWTITRLGMRALARRSPLAELLLGNAGFSESQLRELYGGGPNEPRSADFYEADGLHLKMGKTRAIDNIPAKDGFDLPRGAGNTAAKRRKAIIPDPRNDENLAVAQTHLAMIRFHNRVVDSLTSVPPSQRFAKAREKVTKHYQWMIRSDYCPGSARRASSTMSSTTTSARCSSRELTR